MHRLLHFAYFMIMLLFGTGRRRCLPLPSPSMSNAAAWAVSAGNQVPRGGQDNRESNDEAPRRGPDASE
jgi:hypothetical protein